MKSPAKINSRNKGASFERQIAAQLFGLTGVTFKRDIEQYRTSDRGDLLPDNPAWPFTIECKKYAAGTGCKPAWRDQASKAAVAASRLPCVVYKFDRRDTWVSVPMAAIAAAFGNGATDCGEWVEVSLEGLAYLAGEIMAGAA